MDLNAIANTVIPSVNPLTEVLLRLAYDVSTPTRSGIRTPVYETPGTLVGSIADDVLTVTAVSQGKLAIGQTVQGTGVASRTLITGEIAASGGPGTYRLSRAGQTVASEALTTALLLPAQIQPISWKDLQMLDGLNLAGSRLKFYLHGETDSIVRVQRKGGDLIQVATGGVNDGVWLIAQVMEQFPDWVCCAATLQNQATA